MMRWLLNLRPGLLLLALAISTFLWVIAHESTSVERSFDVPVELHKLDESLVVTDQNVDGVNVRVMGSRAALNNLDQKDLRYAIDVSGAKPGVGVYDIELSRLDLPSGARFVSRSPSQVKVRFEKSGRKAVRVRADTTGTPAPGYHMAGVVIDPAKVWLAGARSQVMRLEEVATEAIDIEGLKDSETREARLVLGGGTLWVEDDAPVQVQIRMEPDLLPDEALLPVESPVGGAPEADNG